MHNKVYFGFLTKMFVWWLSVKHLEVYNPGHGEGAGLLLWQTEEHWADLSREGWWGRPHPAEDCGYSLCHRRESNTATVLPKRNICHNIDHTSNWQCSYTYWPMNSMTSPWPFHILIYMVMIPGQFGIILDFTQNWKIFHPHAIPNSHLSWI